MELDLWGIPPFLFFFSIATAASVCVFMILLYQKKFPIDRYLKYLAVASVGLILTAKLFGCISGVYGTIGRGEAVTWDSVRNTGVVFYGGLIGMLAAYRLALWRGDPDERPGSMDILAVTIPLFHCLSRIGCFLGGCCYGMSCKSPISVWYTTDAFGQIITDQRIPVQLIESLLNLGLFFYLLSLFRREDWQERHILRRYLLIYSVLRFFLEFIRGDEMRGVVAGVSFSQVISVGICLSLGLEYIFQKRKAGGYFS